MKVCTDACLFGAWVAEKVQSEKYGPQSILDIGAGTGLLGLMLAQVTKGMVDAVELDEPAAEQAAENFEASPWHERLQVIRGDARTIHLGRKYDFIISNPPFFENDLKSGNTGRNLALHSEELNLKELLSIIQKHLSVDGKFALLLPYQRKNDFIKIAVEARFYLLDEVAVKQTPVHSFFRAMLLFGTDQATVVSSEISIRDGDTYTNAFTALLKDYYLKL